MSESRRYSALAYFVLTFLLSWGAIFAVFGLGPIEPEQLETKGAFLYVSLLIGPSLAGLILIGLESGGAGFADLGRRLVAWRVPPHWYVVALVAAPLTLVAVLLALSLVPGLMPDVFTTDDLGARVGSGVAAGLVVALCEETGWTGFAIPRMRERHSVIVTGSVVALVWGAWHFPPFWEHDTFSDPVGFGLLLARLFSWLPAFRVLMVWVHDRTQSLLVVILMHMSLVATQFIFVAPFEFSGTAAVVYIVVWAALLWGVAALVTLGSGIPPVEHAHHPEAT